MRRHTIKSGFTLVEILLYMVIAVVLLLLSSNIILNMLSDKTKLSAVFEVSQNGRDAMTRMRLAIRNSIAVVTPSAGTTSTRLVLNMPDAAVDPTIFAVQNGVLKIQEGTTATTSFMSGDVTVPSLLFQNFSTTGFPDSIRITMSVSSTNPSNDPDYAWSQDFIGSAVVRQRP